MKVSFATFVNPFGHLLVAATRQGVCVVSLGEDQAQLEAALRADMAAAPLQPDLEQDGARLQQWVEPLLAYLSRRRTNLDIPLDVQGTPFQQQVWRQLRRIPYGSTRTYGEVAAAMGRPGAARAVAGACAANPVALIIPCHRVISSGGALAGYRWGTDIKARLLNMEAPAAGF